MDPCKDGKAMNIMTNLVPLQHRKYRCMQAKPCQLTAALGLIFRLREMRSTSSRDARHL